MIKNIIKSSEQARKSAKDERVIDFISNLLNSLYWKKDWDITKKECLETLMSMRPQPHCELSKEDNDALEEIIKYHQDLGEVSSKHNKWLYVLERLK